MIRPEIGKGKTLEFFQHHFARSGHRDLLMTRQLTSTVRQPPPHAQRPPHSGFILADYSGVAKEHPCPVVIALAVKRTEGSTKPLLNIPDLRADTPGSETVIHFNNAGCGLLTRPVLQAMHDHVDLEARIGGYEAAAARKAEVRGFYTALADLINTGPDNIAFAGSATDAYSKALSAIDFQPGDVILTTRHDFISNQIAFLALRKRFGIRIVHAPDVPNGEGVDVDAMFALMKSLGPRLVTATHVPNNSGLVQPVAEIGRHHSRLDFSLSPAVLLHWLASSAVVWLKFPASVFWIAASN
jgi:Aminotransferase class-V